VDQYDSGTTTPYQNGTHSYTVYPDSNADEIWIHVFRNNLNTANKIFSCTIKGTGTNPFGGGSTGQRGDAFYYGYDAGDGSANLYTGTNGFRIDAAHPAAIPVYASSHAYQFIAVGTGAPFGFDYVDDDYTDNQNRNLVVTVCGSGMGMS
jgi:hypothetical protein